MSVNYIFFKQSNKVHPPSSPYITQKIRQIWFSCKGRRPRDKKTKGAAENQRNAWLCIAESRKPGFLDKNSSVHTPSGQEEFNQWHPRIPGWGLKDHLLTFLTVSEECRIQIRKTIYLLYIIKITITVSRHSAPKEKLTINKYDKANTTFSANERTFTKFPANERRSVDISSQWEDKYYIRSANEKSRLSLFQVRASRWPTRLVVFSSANTSPPPRSPIAAWIPRIAAGASRKATH
jgi:hypothetical protein